VLYESLVINEYLDEKYPETPLMPKDQGKRAKIRILIDYGMNHLDPPYQTIRKEKMKDEKEQNQEAIEKARKELKSLLGRFEREIGDQPYLAGDFSLWTRPGRDSAPGRWAAFARANLARIGKWLPAHVQRLRPRHHVESFKFRVSGLVEKFSFPHLTRDLKPEARAGLLFFLSPFVAAQDACRRRRHTTLFLKEKVSVRTLPVPHVHAAASATCFSAQGPPRQGAPPADGRTAARSVHSGNFSATVPCPGTSAHLGGGAFADLDYIRSRGCAGPRARRSAACPSARAKSSKPTARASTVISKRI
jgi:hypothetical protein